jgi:hypothetical protein
MKMRTSTVSILAAAGLLASFLSLRAEPEVEPVPYPEGFREWVHVKSTLVGAEAPSFANQGGLHHFYANAQALKGYASGSFPDGSVLIDDLLEGKVSAGVTSEGPRRRLAVMVKDSQRFATTGGWGFEVFKADGREASLTPLARAACFQCHTKAAPDSVFTELRR